MKGKILCLSYVQFSILFCIVLLFVPLFTLFKSSSVYGQTARPINSCITQVTTGTIEDAKSRALALNSSIDFNTEKMVVACNENTSISESSRRIHVFIGKGLGNTVLTYAHNSGFNYPQLSFNNVYRFDYGLGGAYLSNQNITSSTQWRLSEGGDTTNLRHWTHKNATYQASWNTNNYTLTDNAIQSTTIKPIRICPQAPPINTYTEDIRKYNSDFDFSTSKYALFCEYDTTTHEIISWAIVTTQTGDGTNSFMFNAYLINNEVLPYIVNSDPIMLQKYDLNGDFMYTQTFVNGQTTFFMFDGTNWGLANTNITSTHQNYDDWYTGIPQFETMTDPELIRPRVIGNVNDKEVILKATESTIVKSINPNYKIKWLLTYGDIDGNIQIQTWDGLTDPEQTLTFNAPHYGQYALTAKYTDENGTPLADTSAYNFEDWSTNLDINGDVFSFDGDAMSCDVNNYCEVPEPVEWTDEPCDLLNLGGCVNNIMHYLAVWLGINKTDKNPNGLVFLNQETDTHGLTAVITAPLNIFTNLSQANYTCNQVTLPLPYMGNRNIVLPCLSNFYQSTGGQLYTLWQTITGGIIAYYSYVQLLAIVKGFKDPKSDKIEVTKL